MAPADAAAAAAVPVSTPRDRSSFLLMHAQVWASQAAPDATGYAAWYARTHADQPSYAWPLHTEAIRSWRVSQEVRAQQEAEARRAAATSAVLESADPSEGAEMAGITISHDADGTRVSGTSKDDTQVRHALTSAGFKWSRRQDFWYVPRSWREATRADRLATWTIA
ncbi:hypothetical protein FDA94_13755 [Herbidospora galbida]|uniref:Uncharacterized protein n=1 Tax=Herbidospora galbida TaxID=2575442 RepID=A0A4U3MIY8_9ACTN|nr:hypothetical protein [Herbidospora galbida]TKK88364.1 hypothetical protein FDA94_13755 [Herbidospora galbida]